MENQINGQEQNPIETPPLANQQDKSFMQNKQDKKTSSMPTNELMVHKIEQIMMFSYFFIAALLLFRFVLSLFGANRSSLFVDFVYQLTTPFMFPFENMFGAIGVGDYIIEFEIAIALVVYALLMFGIARLSKIFLTK